MSVVALKAEPGDEDVISGLRADDEWKYTWARAVAKAWESEEYRELLLNDATAALLQFGYTIPMGTKLNVEKYTGEHEFIDLDGSNGWIHFKNELASSVTMVLPPTPTLEKRAIALADYQATGRTYPFTCI